MHDAPTHHSTLPTRPLSCVGLQLRVWVWVCAVWVLYRDWDSRVRLARVGQSTGDASVVRRREQIGGVTSIMASLIGALGFLAFHSFILAWTKRLYAVGWRLGLSSLSVCGQYMLCRAREPPTGLGRLGVGALGGCLGGCFCWR